jgi:SAM-dependent methyltransferase
VADFSADWLALREAADHAARSDRLARTVAGAIGGRTPIRIVDLGCGTGSNLRYLAPRLPPAQQWLLVDRDAALLAAARALTNPQRVETREIDLARIGDRSARALFAGSALVTASALLDLVSASWIDTLATICAEVGAAALVALSYDGRIACAPAETHDERVRRLVNEHQGRDKGFGPALGPDATAHAARVFAAHGYHVEREQSDWVLPPEMAALQRELIAGWASAAAQIAPDESAAIDAWRARRLAHVEGGRSHIIVGHDDLLALPHRAAEAPRT